MALVHPPPPRGAVNPIYLTLAAGTVIHRIYDPDAHGASAAGFRQAGPFARFDHHKKAATARGILYAGADFKCCLAEVYGDARFGLALNRRHCELELARSLKLLDLRGDGAARAGTITAVCAGGYRIAQRWSRYFYEHQRVYGSIDGLTYRNAHNEGTAYALFERAADALANVTYDGRLDDRRRNAEYVDAAIEVHIVIGFYGSRGISPSAL